MSTPKQVSDGGPDGLKLGQSAADLVAFHGTAPIAQATLTTLVSGTLGDVNASLNALITALRAKGLFS